MLTPYRRRKKITIDHTLIDAALSDFPMLVSISGDTDIGANAKSNGDDIRFTTDDGKTEINYEIEDFAITTGSATGNFWVKVPLVSSKADTIIFMYYGHETASTGANTTAVWDDNYQMVHHMNGDATITDSTSNSHDGTTTDTTEVSGQIGTSQDFNGSTSIVSIPDDISLRITGDISISCWVYNRSTSLSMIITKRTPNNSVGSSFAMSTSSSQFNWFFGDGSSNRNQQYTAESLPLNEWVYIHCTRASGIMRTFWNAIEKGSPLDLSSYAPQPVTEPVNIGFYDGGQYINGQIDELRISTVARSPAWVKASYHSENNSLATISPEIKKRFTKTLNGVSARKIKTINGIDVTI